MALTAGDPRGIGPEVMEAALHRILDGAEAEPEELLLIGARGHQVEGVPFEEMGAWDGTEPGAGRVTVEAIRRAVALGREGRIHGLVTGPAHKPALRAAGFPVPGQTELLRDLTGARRAGMLMAAEETELGPPLRVLLTTTHLPLRDVFAVLTTELVVEQARLLHEELQRGWGFAAPRIVFCGVNPHASDGGLFGDEERRVLAPAVERLQEEGIVASGPVPADTVFHRTLGGEFDAVVAPYHDVGMAAFKTVSFGRGVNVTLGLPLVRTSPDHGTAFDLAGRGEADPSSMLAALRLAIRLARSRFDSVRAQA